MALNISTTRPGDPYARSFYDGCKNYLEPVKYKDYGKEQLGALEAANQAYKEGKARDLKDAESRKITTNCVINIIRKTFKLIECNSLNASKKKQDFNKKKLTPY